MFLGIAAQLVKVELISMIQQVYLLGSFHDRFLSGHHVEENSVRQSDKSKEEWIQVALKKKRIKLTGRPLISEPWSRSRARSAARKSNYM